MSLYPCSDDGFISDELKKKSKLAELWSWVRWCWWDDDGKNLIIFRFCHEIRAPTTTRIMTTRTMAFDLLFLRFCVSCGLNWDRYDDRQVIMKFYHIEVYFFW